MTYLVDNLVNYASVTFDGDFSDSDVVFHLIKCASEPDWKPHQQTYVCALEAGDVFQLHLSDDSGLVMFNPKRANALTMVTYEDAANFGWQMGWLIEVEGGVTGELAEQFAEHLKEKLKEMRENNEQVH